MKRSFFAAAIAALGSLIGSSANAHASATLNFDGFALQTFQGYDWGYDGFHIDLAPGETRSYVFNYSGTIMAEGYSIDPNTAIPYCLGLHNTYCGPESDTSESALAYLSFDAEGRYGFNEWMDYTGTGNSRAVYSTEHGYERFSGSFTVNVRNTDTWFTHPADFGVVGALWVTASPLPEPGSYAYMGGALALVAIARRRAAQAASFSLRGSNDSLLDECQGAL